MWGPHWDTARRYPCSPAYESRTAHVGRSHAVGRRQMPPSGLGGLRALTHMALAEERARQNGAPEQRLGDALVLIDAQLSVHTETEL